MTVTLVSPPSGPYNDNLTTPHRPLQQATAPSQALTRVQLCDACVEVGERADTSPGSPRPARRLILGPRPCPRPWPRPCPCDPVVTVALQEKRQWQWPLRSVRPPPRRSSFPPPPPLRRRPLRSEKQLSCRYKLTSTACDAGRLSEAQAGLLRLRGQPSSYTAAPAARGYLN